MSLLEKLNQKESVKEEIKKQVDEEVRKQREYDKLSLIGE